MCDLLSDVARSFVAEQDDDAEPRRALLAPLLDGAAPAPLLLALAGRWRELMHEAYGNATELPAAWAADCAALHAEFGVRLPCAALPPPAILGTSELAALASSLNEVGVYIWISGLNDKGLSLLRYHVYTRTWNRTTAPAVPCSRVS